MLGNKKTNFYPMLGGRSLLNLLHAILAYSINVIMLSKTLCQFLKSFLLIFGGVTRKQFKDILEGLRLIKF